MIASYRDFQCRETIAKAFLRAKLPFRLYIGAVDQVVDGDIGCLDFEKPCDEYPEQVFCQYLDNISVYKMNASLSVGPVMARHVGQRLYRGQYYSMQLDAHCDFVQDWDVNLAQQWKELNNEMAVLSSYLTDVQGSIDKDGKSLRTTRPIMCNSDFEGVYPTKYIRHGAQPEGAPAILHQPQLQPYWAAGFSFARGHFLLRVPYDAYQPMVFQGEEIEITVRGFTYGYDFYAPRESVIFHEYATKSNRRKKIPLFWENKNTHVGEEKKSLKRGLSIIKMANDIPDEEWNHQDQEMYGLGNVRDVNLFYKLFLIDPDKRQSVMLCPFVNLGKLHKDFQKHMRSDKLGLNYTELADYDTFSQLKPHFTSELESSKKLLEEGIVKKQKVKISNALKTGERFGLQLAYPNITRKGELLLYQLKNNF